MKWAALFSQTGSEICNLSEKLGHYPDLVISDNTNEANIVDPRIELNCKKLLWRKYKGLTKEEKLDYYRKHLQGYDIVTLHGCLILYQLKYVASLKSITVTLALSTITQI